LRALARIVEEFGGAKTFCKKYIKELKTKTVKGIPGLEKFVDLNFYLGANTVLNGKVGFEGEVYIDGAVASPGLYHFTSEDSLAALIQAAGGITGSANLSGCKFDIPEVGKAEEPQKVDINRAEVWLLESLPGIGQTLAQRIVDYRRENGPFRNTSELLKVAGIGTSTYQQIKDLLTVAD